MALDAGTVVGSYRVEAVLGRGGMATVYSARHVEHGRRVALKVLAGALSEDPEFVARFRREGRLQASLEHPHVVTVYEAGESELGLWRCGSWQDPPSRRSCRSAHSTPPAP